MLLLTSLHLSAPPLFLGMPYPFSLTPFILPCSDEVFPFQATSPENPTIQIG